MFSHELYCCVDPHWWLTHSTSSVIHHCRRRQGNLYAGNERHIPTSHLGVLSLLRDRRRLALSCLNFLRAGASCRSFTRRRAALGISANSRLRSHPCRVQQ